MGVGDGVGALCIVDSRRYLLVAWILAGVAVTPVCAQKPELEAGDRIRVWLTSIDVSDEFGRLIALRGDTPVMALDERGDLAAPFTDVSRLRVSRGSRRFVLEGPLIAGIGMGVVLWADCEAQVRDGCTQSREGRDELVILWALVSAVGGGLVGALIRTERWDDVSVEALGSSSPYPNRVRVAWRVPLRR